MKLSDASFKALGPSQEGLYFMGLDFNDTTTNLGLLQHINFLCGLPRADTTRYTTADKTRNCNIAYRKILGWIWKAQGGWIFEDTNLLDLPYFRTDCVSGQEDYTLPSGYGVVERIEYKDISGIWRKLVPITQQELRNQGKEEFMKTNGTPVFVELFGNSYRPYPAANRTSVDGDSLRVYCTRDIDEFTAADTTQEPGYNSNWHDTIALIAAQLWSIRDKDQERYNMLLIDINAARSDIEQYYGNRANLQQENIKPRNRQYMAR